MGKRATLIVSMAAIAAMAIAASVAIAGPTGTGSDGNTQSIDATIAPKKLSKSVFTPGSLKVVTKTTTTTAANGVPSPAVHAVIDFDKNAKILTKGLPTCESGKLQSVSTEAAEKACPGAKIGTGKATVLLPVGEKVFTVEAKVTAFNGKPKGGKPVVILHTYATTPITTVVVLIGSVSNYNKQGYGPRLDLEIPLLAGGAGAIQEFQVTINRKYRYKGKPASFITAKCPKSKILKTRSVFTFKDGESIQANDTQPCTQKK